MAGPIYKAEFKGLEKLQRQLRARPEQITHAGSAALYVDAEQLIGEAKQLTPVDEGVLRASGHVQLPVNDGHDVLVLAGFGGPAGAGNQGETNAPTKKNPTGDVGYAVYVHEDLTAHHTVGQAKFLETPFMRRLSGFGERIAARIRSRLRVV